MVAGKMASKMLIYFIENKITVKKERTHYLSEPCGARDHSAYPHSLCFSSCLRLLTLVSLDDGLSLVIQIKALLSMLPLVSISSQQEKQSNTTFFSMSPVADTQQ